MVNKSSFLDIGGFPTELLEAFNIAKSFVKNNKNANDNHNGAVAVVESEEKQKEEFIQVIESGEFYFSDNDFITKLFPSTQKSVLNLMSVLDDMSVGDITNRTLNTLDSIDLIGDTYLNDKNKNRFNQNIKLLKELASKSRDKFLVKDITKVNELLPILFDDNKDSIPSCLTTNMRVYQDIIKSIYIMEDSRDDNQLSDKMRESFFERYAEYSLKLPEASDSFDMHFLKQSFSWLEYYLESRINGIPFKDFLVDLTGISHYELG